MNWYHYWYRRYLGWVPVQFCMVCGKPYWGGWPRFIVTKESGFSVKLGTIGRTHSSWVLRNTWQPWWQDYCSRKCANEDLDLHG